LYLNKKKNRTIVRYKKCTHNSTKFKHSQNLLPTIGTRKHFGSYDELMIHRLEEKRTRKGWG
jgi:hypothetical protein